MRDILLFTLDDLGDRQGYVIAIFAIVLLAIGGVLLRDAYAWFEGLSAQPLDDEALASEADELELAEGQGDHSVPVARATAFATAPTPAFGRRHSQAA